MFRKCSSLTFHCKKRFVSTKPSFQEVRIPVPWGHIAGKWWGPTDKRPILTLHGWQDNCGTFDLLIPKLPQNVGYLAIDFTGHGHSSKLPPGMFYYNINTAILIKRLKEYFKWDKISLMGHSLGGMGSYQYGFLYPSTVDFMICIDGFQTVINTKGVENHVKNIERFLKYDAQNNNISEPPSFSMEELAVKLSKGSMNSIDLDKAKYILERNVKPSKNHPGKFYLDRDVRLKCGSLLLWSPKEVVEAAGRIKCPLFLSRSAGTPFFKDKYCFPQVYEVLKKNPHFEFHDIAGSHHGHLNNPEYYEKILPEFIKKYDTHDRSQIPIIDEIRLKT